MTTGASRFFNSIKDSNALIQGDLIDLFVYYLTVELGEPFATSLSVNRCFTECDLKVPTRTGTHLSEGARGKRQRIKFVRVPSRDGGYKLERTFREELSKRLGAELVVAQTSVELRRLETVIPAGPKRDFLIETINCFEAGANRATIVMCWILAMDHMFDHVFIHKLTDFNAALAKSPPSRGITKITSRDDFTELKESKFIELCRAASIITNDVRKILDEKLGTRNSSAHASGVTIKSSKVIDFVEDLITNVVLKFPA
jgi:hypothetical protein